ncbi:MAG: NTP transferase domain-containing protein [Deltaproteobacteria bacterium]|nr:NTP transferase domain-containing protein [Deltaproteobacteria bacterium]
MKALITTAGLGTRLEKMRHTNKCLLEVGDRSILRRSLDSLHQHGIHEVYVVTGHFAEKVEKEVVGKATCLFNPFYKVSGIVISIWFAKSFLYKEDFIFLTGDVVYDSGLIDKILKIKKDIVIPMEKKNEYDKEDSKVIARDGKVESMGKRLPLSKVSGEFCCIAAFNNRGSKHLFDKIDSFLTRGKLKTNLMAVFNELIADGVHLTPIDVTGIPRIEIDFLKDLEDARKRVLPLIDSKPVSFYR